MTRPTAKKIENVTAISRNTNTNSKSNGKSATSASESRVTAATASSKAKFVSHNNASAAAVPSKRKREILAEVTDTNHAGTSKAITTARPRTRQAVRSTTTTTTTTARVGLKKPVRVPPYRKTDDAPVTRQPVFSRPQPAATKEVLRAVLEEEEDRRVTKKRHTGERITVTRVETVPPSEGSHIDEERVAHQLSVPEGDDDEDTTELWDDIDAQDMDDPLMVAEYAAEICRYWKEIEVDLLYPSSSSTDT